MAPQEYAVPNELLENLDRLCRNRAEQRLMAEECVRIYMRLDAVEVGQFVIVKQPGIVIIESAQSTLTTHCSAFFTVSLFEP